MAAGFVGVTVTLMVAEPELLGPPRLAELGEEEVATLPNEVTTPGVMTLSGKVIATRSPAATSDCCDVSRSTVTTRVVDVADMMAWPTGADAPKVAETDVTRAALGRNTASPRLSVPFALTPRADWSFSTARVVQLLNTSEPAGISELLA